MLLLLMEDPAQPGRGGPFRIDFSEPRPDAGGGLPCFLASSHALDRAALMAVQIAPLAPARGRAFSALATPPPHILAPLAMQPATRPDGAEAGFVICTAPPGPSLANCLAGGMAPWSEADLCDRLLRPVAVALEGLRLAGLPHRGIRPNNMYLSTAGGMVVLGCAWAAPPAAHQPALFEPPYSAAAHPAARGDGRVADDVYALGVLLAVLATGQMPMEGLDDAAVLRRKLELGSLAAVAEGLRLPPLVADLLRGMLAEDPEHRPPPLLLLDPAAARARRVAARPQRRAQRPLDLSGEPFFHVRPLAQACASQPEAAIKALRNGAVSRWVRREIGDPILAGGLDDFLRHRELETIGDSTTADGLLLCRAVALLDPLAPLAWQGVQFWPDGMGPALTDIALAPRLQAALLHEAIPAWADLRPDRLDPVALRFSTRQQRATLSQNGPGQGLARLLYMLNPLLPCLSPQLRGRWVARIADLLPALEQAATLPDRPAAGPFDVQIAAFVGARMEQAADSDLALLGGVDPAAAALAQLRLCARLQDRGGPAELPRLAGWLGDLAQSLVDGWPNLNRRRAAAERLPALVNAGRLSALRLMLDDLAADAEDRARLRAVAAAVAKLDAEIAALDRGNPARVARAVRMGQQMAAGMGALTLLGAALLMVL